MNVTIPTRLKRTVLERLQEVAKARGTTVSKLFTEGIHDAINGHRTIEIAKKDEKKKTSFTIDHDLIVTFKAQLEAKNIALEAGLERLAELIADNVPLNSSN